MYGFYSFLKVFLRIEGKLDALLRVSVQILEHYKKPQLVEAYDQWLDNQEVMQRLHWSRSTLQRRRDDGSLPYTKVKGKYYYREADIFRMLNCKF